MLRNHWKTVLGFVTLLALVGIWVWQTQFAPKPHPQPANVSPAVTTSAGTVDPATQLPTQTPSAPADTHLPDVSETSAAAQLGTAFAAAYLRTDITKEQWLSGLRPMVDDSIFQTLTDFNPNAIPTVKVIGDASVVEADNETLTVTVPTSKGNFDLVIPRAKAGGKPVITGLLPPASESDED